jgi:signal transduction histidine kinase
MLANGAPPIYHLAVLRDHAATHQPKPGTDPEVARLCPLPAEPPGIDALTSELARDLLDAGCPLAPAIQDRLRFEILLTELSATFVNVPASQVDSQIESGLRRLVETLAIDRSDLTQISDGKQFVVTHSYQLPGVPPSPRLMLQTQFPKYTRMIRQGMVIRLPKDLPPEAVQEREYCLRVGLKSNLTIPLTVMGSVVGGIGFSCFRSHRAWSEELIERLRLVGDIFTNALARRRTDEALSAKELALRQSQESFRQLAAKLLHAQEEERCRIAREMHDDWTQRLAMLGIDAAKLERHLGTPEKSLPLLHTMREQLVSLSEDVHDLSRQLHPSILDDLGLAEALRSECASFSRREEIAVDYRPGIVPANVPKDTALGVYRVAQEALRNLAKHSAVGEAWVSLDTAGSELCLRVEDKGTGFDLDIVRFQPGLGLSSMMERVRLIRGNLSITSEPGRGTVVEVRVPLTGGD